MANNNNNLTLTADMDGLPVELVLTGATDTLIVRHDGDFVIKSGIPASASDLGKAFVACSQEHAVESLQRRLPNLRFTRLEFLIDGGQDVIETFDPPMGYLMAMVKATTYWQNPDQASKPEPKPEPQPTAVATPTGQFDPITLPDGSVYYPRAVPDITDDGSVISDVELIQRAVLKAKMNLLLIGAPGDGKTVGLFAALGVITKMHIDADTSRGDIMGQGYFKSDGSTGYHFGPLPTAATHKHDSDCESGCNRNILYADEVNAGSPTVLKALHPFADTSSTIETSEHGTLVKSPDARLVASINPNEVGTHLSNALASRMQVHIEWQPDYEIAKRLKVPAPIIKASIKLAKMKANGEPLGTLPSMRDLLAFRDSAKEFGMTFAWRNFIGRVSELDRDMYLSALATEHGLTGELSPLSVQGAYLQTN